MEQVQARITQDISNIVEYKPESIRFDGNQVLGCSNSRNMGFLLGYCSEEESLKRREPIQREMDQYNKAVEALWATEGFPNYFYKVHYYLPIEEIREHFGEATASIAVSIKAPTNCNPELIVLNGVLLLKSNEYKTNFEYQGKTYELSSDSFSIEDEYILTRDVSLYISCDEQQLRALQYAGMNLIKKADIDEETRDMLHYDISSSYELSIDNTTTNAVNYFIQLLARRGYVHQFQITNGSPEYSAIWDLLARNDASVLYATEIDYSALKEPLLKARLNCLFSSLKVYDEQTEDWVDNVDFSSPLFFLQDATNTMYLSKEKAVLGGHDKLKIYGRLDCPSAARYLRKGQYVSHRVFFADEETAIKAGYRPCGTCMKEAYIKWKAAQAHTKEEEST